VNACVAGVVSKAGRIDVYHNAGFAYVDLMEAITIEQAKKDFDTNVFGVNAPCEQRWPQDAQTKERPGDGRSAVARAG